MTTRFVLHSRSIIVQKATTPTFLGALLPTMHLAKPHSKTDKPAKAQPSLGHNLTLLCSSAIQIPFLAAQLARFPEVRDYEKRKGDSHFKIGRFL